jgi:O-antigen ligase
VKSKFVLPQRIKEYSLLLIEGLILLILVVAFWHHTGPQTPIRESWLWLLWLAFPIFALRLAIHRRIWVETPLNNLLIAFILLTVFNFSSAPMHREGYLVVVGRPFLGIWMYFYFLELASVTKKLSLILIATVGMAFVLGLLALVATQWLPEKSGSMAFIIDWLPKFDYRAAANQFNGSTCIPLSSFVLPDGCFNPGDVVRNSLFSFNPNEIAGALAWVTPVMLAIALGYHGENEQSEGHDWSGIALRVAAALVFTMLFLALFLGQSRFAILGVIIGLILLVRVFVPNGIWRYLGLGIIGVIVLIQLAIILNIQSPSNATQGPDLGLTKRDQTSVWTRLQIWQRGLQMMLDYPLTGTGMAMFRTAVNRPPYQIPYYVETGQYPPPHAHNEWIQMGADLGVPGFILYITWQVVVLWMLRVGWQRKDVVIKLTAMACFSGLLAHATYGLGDAVTLWDRYQFVLWWLVGLAGAQYVLAKMREEQALPKLEEG